MTVTVPSTVKDPPLSVIGTALPIIAVIESVPEAKAGKLKIETALPIIAVTESVPEAKAGCVTISTLPMLLSPAGKVLTLTVPSTVKDPPLSVIGTALPMIAVIESVPEAKAGWVTISTLPILLSPAGKVFTETVPSTVKEPPLSVTGTASPSKVIFTSVESYPDTPTVPVTEAVVAPNEDTNKADVVGSTLHKELVE